MESKKIQNIIPSWSNSLKFVFFIYQYIYWTKAKKNFQRHAIKKNSKHNIDFGGNYLDGFSMKLIRKFEGSLKRNLIHCGNVRPSFRWEHLFTIFITAFMKIKDKALNSCKPQKLIKIFQFTPLFRWYSMTYISFRFYLNMKKSFKKFIKLLIDLFLWFGKDLNINPWKETLKSFDPNKATKPINFW